MFVEFPTRERQCDSITAEVIRNGLGQQSNRKTNQGRAKISAHDTGAAGRGSRDQHSVCGTHREGDKDPVGVYAVFRLRSAWDPDGIRGRRRIKVFQ